MELVLALIFLTVLIVAAGLQVWRLQRKVEGLRLRISLEESRALTVHEVIVSCEDKLKEAYHLLKEYEVLYNRRIHNNDPVKHPYSSQAADIVREEGHQRAVGVQSEIRVVALAVIFMFDFLESLKTSHRVAYGEYDHKTKKGGPQ